MTPDGFPQHDDPKIEEALGRRVVVERIDKADMRPLYDGNHTHVYKPDDTDITDDYIAHQCIHCPVGVLIRKET